MSGGLDERYVLLGLRLGRHVAGLVDFSVGPPELASAVAAEALVEPDALVVEARALADALAGDVALDPDRRAWLADQVHGVETAARVLAGEQLSYVDEVEGCYGVRPVPAPPGTYETAHAQLDELLPGSGSLHERHEAWRETCAVPGALVPRLLEQAATILREPTARLVDLPPGESVVVEPVSDEPWWAFNYYLGARRSRVVVNVDITTTATDVVHLAGHEVYPGHHTEHALKEHLLVDGRGWLEEAIHLVPTPAAVVSEGLAELGQELLVDDDLQERLARVFTEAGVDPDFERGTAIARARKPLGRVSLDAALLIHGDGAPHDEARAYVERWALMSPQRAANSVRFVTDPTWRAYVVTYSAGRELCEAFVGGDRSRLVRLLTGQVRVSELLGGGSAAGG